ncbi:MAG: SDR family NAD(P)-dependent oxidoreductase [Acetivibrio ethanolgignens]
MRDKILLISGASSDVGISYIKKSHEKYKKIIAHYRSSVEELELLKAVIGNKLVLLRADLASQEETYRLAEEIASLGEIPTHILHLPADKFANYKFQKTNWEVFQRDIDIQLRSAAIILKRVLPEMKKKKYGKVVIMLSSCTKNTAPSYLSSYVSVKYALLGLIKALSSEYAAQGICINGVSPCMMETKMLSEIPSLIVEQNAEKNPQKRNAKVEDICPVLEFLLSDEAGFITGQNILVSGGEN